MIAIVRRTLPYPTQYGVTGLYPYESAEQVGSNGLQGLGRLGWLGQFLDVTSVEPDSGGMFSKTLQTIAKSTPEPEQTAPVETEPETEPGMLEVTPEVVEPEPEPQRTTTIDPRTLFVPQQPVSTTSSPTAPSPTTPVAQHVAGLPPPGVQVGMAEVAQFSACCYPGPTYGPGNLSQVMPIFRLYNMGSPVFETWGRGGETVGIRAQFPSAEGFAAGPYSLKRVFELPHTVVVGHQHDMIRRGLIPARIHPQVGGAGGSGGGTIPSEPVSPTGVESEVPRTVQTAPVVPDTPVSQVQPGVTPTQEEQGVFAGAFDWLSNVFPQQQQQPVRQPVQPTQPFRQQDAFFVPRPVAPAAPIPVTTNGVDGGFLDDTINIAGFEVPTVGVIAGALVLGGVTFLAMRK